MNENKLQQAIDAIHAGKPQTAQVLLAQILKDDIHQDSAWVWMASLQDDPIRKMQCLERALKANPDNAQARQMLADLAPGTDTKPEGYPPAPPGELEPVQPAEGFYSPQSFEPVQEQAFTSFQPVQVPEKAPLEPQPVTPAPQAAPALETAAQAPAAAAPLSARPARRILPSDEKPNQPSQPGFDAESYRSLAQTKSKPALSGMSRSQVIALVLLGVLTLIMIAAVVAVVGMTFNIF